MYIRKKISLTAIAGAAEHLQPLCVFFQLGNLSHAAIQARQKLAMQRTARRGEGVIAPQSLLSDGNEPGAAQICQVSRYFRLRCGDCADQIADAYLAAAQK